MQASDIFILCVEDEQEVLDAVVRDLEKLEDLFPVETATTAEEAREVVQTLLDEGKKIGLILCDHILPGDNGVELLIELHKKESMHRTRKVLLTGQAGLDDTVKALNQARLHHYIAKPWTRQNLLEVATGLLTDYVIDEEEDLLPFMSTLDAAKISEAIRTRRMADE